MILGISAQTEQGVIVLEGNSNLNLGNATVAEYHQSIAEYTHDFPSLLPENVFTTTRFSVNSSYFIINNLAIGATLNYTSTLINYDDNILPDVEISYLSYGILSRYYFGNIWGQASYTIGQVETYENYMLAEVPGTFIFDSDEEVAINTFAFNVGYAVYLTPNVAINPSLGYTMTNSTIARRFQNENGEYYGDHRIKDIRNGFNFSFGIALHLGG